MTTNMYIAASYICSLLAAAALTPLVVGLARRWGVLDVPGARKVHAVPMPRIGGLAIAIAMLGTAVPICAAVIWNTNEIVSERTPFATLLIASVFVLVVGFCDDLMNLSGRYKLVALLAASVAFCFAGGLITEINFNGQRAIQLGVFAWPVTLLWLVAVTVSVNFIDGLDGLAAGIVAFACAVLAVGAAVSWQVPVLLLSLALLGSLSGFLFYNFSPAKVFMGDCGSMFIGFTFAGLAALYTKHGTSTGGLLLPALALSIPFFDLLLTMVRRSVLQRRSVFSAESGHIHHRLLAIGMRHVHAVLLLYMATAAAALVGLSSLLRVPWVFYSGLLLLVTALLLLFRAAGSVRGRETIEAVRRNRTIARETRRDQHAFEEMQLRFRNVKTFDDWWVQVCGSADALGLLGVVLPIKNRDGTPRVLRWARPESTFLECESITAKLPIRQRRTGGPINAEVEVAVLSTLEAAGQRLALFSRLMGEHSLATLQTPPAYAGAGQGPKARRGDTRRRTPGGQLIDRALPAEKPRVALVHDFLYTYAGAERVVEQILQVYPDADVFSLFDFLPPDQRDFIRNKQVRTSFIHKLPFSRLNHRAYLPLMPLAIEQLDVSSYDIVISSSYCVAKGVLTRPDQLHICYCHSPMRFAWDLQNQYLNQTGLVRGLKSLFARLILHYVRTWDARSAMGVDLFVTNSDFIGRRVEKVYRRQSVTIYPPVDVETFRPGNERSDFYVTASRMVPYKRIDLIVEAFTAMPEKRLIVIGDGPEMERIRAKAGPNIKLVGQQSAAELRRYMRLAKGFVFAAEEDFGIVLVEAQACGTPVIAFRRGGAVETVIPGVTGVFFEEQTVEAIMDAVEDFELVGTWDHQRVRHNAERFSNQRFQTEFEGLVNAQWERFKLSRSNRRGRDLSAAADEAAPASWNEPVGLDTDDDETPLHA